MVYQNFRPNAFWDWPLYWISKYKIGAGEVQCMDFESGLLIIIIQTFSIENSVIENSVLIHKYTVISWSYHSNLNQHILATLLNALFYTKKSLFYLACPKLDLKS